MMGHGDYQVYEGQVSYRKLKPEEIKVLKIKNAFQVRDIEVHVWEDPKDVLKFTVRWKLL